MWSEWPMVSSSLVVVTAVVLLMSLWICSSWLLRSTFSLDGRVVVITGGARGIGRRLAETVLRKATGVTLVLLDVDGEALAHTQRELLEVQLARVGARATGRTSVAANSADSKVLIFKCDVSKERDVAACVAKISQAVAPKKITVLVNNAGIVNGRSIDALSSADVRRTFEVNTLGQIWMIQAILPLLKQSHEEGQGSLVVSVASVMGLISGANLADYCASKAAVSAFHDCLRLELWRDKFSQIRTLLVCPNAVDTGMFEGIMQGSDFTAWLSRLLLPASSETDAAERIFHAMVTGEQFVVSCYDGWRGVVVPWLPSIARLLPVSLFDRVVFLGGGVHGMDTFVGRKRKEE